MIARVCAAQVARQIVRALHLPPVEGPPVAPPKPDSPKRKASAKGRKKKKAA